MEQPNLQKMTESMPGLATRFAPPLDKDTEYTPPNVLGLINWAGFLVNTAMTEEQGKSFVMEILETYRKQIEQMGGTNGI
jgi:hypothetical protein